MPHFNKLNNLTMNEITLNNNHAECIKYMDSIGHTIYTNVCNGTSTVIQWGSMDWIGFVGMAILGIAFIVKMIIR